MKYADHLAEDRRLVLLRLLEEAPRYAANVSVLHAGIERIGHHVSRDQVRTDVAWLEEQGLVTLLDLQEGILVVTATERGVDAAHGRAIIPGVRRPGPGR